MNLMVNYLSREIQPAILSEADFKSFFSRYGKITSLDMNNQNQHHWSGVVCMEERPASMRVIQRYLNGCFWHGGCISVYVPLFFQEHTSQCSKEDKRTLM